MTESHWSHYHSRWARLGAPLRPNGEVVAAIVAALGDLGPTLLYGVTPELADIASSVIAVDRSEAMIRGVWPGDTDRRRAVSADWLELPFGAATFAAAVGDGSPNALFHPDNVRRLLEELARVLRPGGRAVLRVFCTPGRCESVEEAMAEAFAGRIGSFHAFKWRLAMALVAGRGTASIPVRAIVEAFDGAVQDRGELASRAGWEPSDIDTIDVYRESTEVYCFPTEREFLEILPPSFSGARFVSSGTYELADRCPLLIIDRVPEPRRNR